MDSFLSERIKLPELQKNVWTEFAQLARQHNSINLGQGFPTFSPLPNIPLGLSEATLDGTMMNQYSRDFGKNNLVESLSKFYSPLFNKTIFPFDEILVTNGAYFALYSICQTIINSGDEVIIIEPFFDCYLPMVKLAGGVPKFIKLKPNENDPNEPWTIDFNELDSLKSPKLKAIIINNPNNPLGKIFTLEEMQKFADFCISANIICISDEVYEHLVYKPKKHIRIAALPGMFERTVSVYSAGKTWSVTGWKTGWMIGPSVIIKANQLFWTNSGSSNNTPVQEAIARGFDFEMNRNPDIHATENDKSYFVTLANDELLPKRERMASAIRKLGLEPIVPEGGYFMMASVKKLKKIHPTFEGEDSTRPWDVQFLRWLTRVHGITAIPVSAFYGPDKNDDFIRFCFAKDDKTFDDLENKIAAIDLEAKN